MNLVVDVGNTRTKLAVFKNKELKKIITVAKEEVLVSIKLLFSDFSIQNAIVSKVAEIPEETINYLHKATQLFILDSRSKVPFYNSYKTKNTLGIDRVALVAGAAIQYPKNHVLVIDAGTCITYDFKNDKQEYFGGAISPGLAMRYKALNNYTAKLPLLTIESPKNFIGSSTADAIHSGVVNGLVQEIEGVIKQYKTKFLHLTVVLTGGDTKFLSKQLKSSIFANQNFLLEGLNEILIFNNNK